MSPISELASNRQGTPKVNWQWLTLILFIVAILPYLGIWEFEFVTFDDPKYVQGNEQVKAGITWASIQWAFTSGYASNWHPLTWISHMLDVDLFGLNAGAHHTTNVLLHGFNTLLLFGFLAQATGCRGRSAFVAALFAAHPLHVESVAWISERKDVLSAFFMLLTLWTYFRYTTGPTLLSYLGVVFLFTLGLMAKPMLVTLPFMLLLLDGWPLNRIRLKPFDWSMALRLIIEKLPLFALAATSSVITFIVQQEGGAIANIDNVPLMLRLGNAAVSYIQYILNMFAPIGLAVLYPFPESVPMWKALGSTVALVTISAFAVKLRGMFSYFPVGWFLFLGTLIPVIGIVQVGSQAMADRYTYIPMIGLFIVVAWGSYDLLGRGSSKQAPLLVTAVLIIATLTAMSWTQARYWQNSNFLWARAVDATSDNYRAHTAYGSLMEDQGALTQAVKHFTRAAQIQPSHAIAHNKLGAVLSDLNRPVDAIGHYENALRIQPDFAEAHNNLGNALNTVGRREEALKHFKKAISIKPNYPSPYNGLGSALDDLGRVDEAITNYSEAIRIDPQYAAAYNNLATAYYKKSMLDEAVEASRIALKLEPGNASYQFNHAVYMFYSGDIEVARNHLELSLKINPGYTPAIEALKMLPEGNGTSR